MNTIVIVILNTHHFIQITRIMFLKVALVCRNTAHAYIIYGRSIFIEVKSNSLICPLLRKGTTFCAIHKHSYILYSIIIYLICQNRQGFTKRHGLYKGRYMDTYRPFYYLWSPLNFQCINYMGGLRIIIDTLNDNSGESRL